LKLITIEKQNGIQTDISLDDARAAALIPFYGMRRFSAGNAGHADRHAEDGPQAKFFPAPLAGFCC
jgi:hypothetical protein